MQRKIMLFFTVLLLLSLIPAASAQNIELDVKEGSKTTCQCTSARFDLAIRNTGNFTETYTFSTEPKSKYMTFDKREVILPAGAKTGAVMDVLLPCDLTGTLNLVVKAHARKSSYTAKIPVKLHVESCYAYSMSVLELVNETPVPASEVYEFCENQTKILSVLIENLDEQTNTYKAKLYGPGWVSLNGNQVSLQEGQQAVFELNIEPVEEGNFDITVDFTSSLGNINKRETIAVDVKNCYIPRVAPEVSLFKIGYKDTNKTLTITNTGKKTADYLLTLEGPGWVKIIPNAVSAEPQKLETFTLNTNPPKDAEDRVYDIKITATTPIGNSYAKDVKLNLKKPHQVLIFAGKAFGFLKANISYILAGIVLLAIILAAIISSKKIKPKRAKKIVKKEAKKEIKKEAKKGLKRELKKEAKPEGIKPKKPKKKLSIALYVPLLIALLVIAAAVLYYTTDPVQEAVNKAFNRLFPAPEKRPAEIKPILDIDKADVLVLGFILGYKYYFLTGIVVLVVFILLIKKAREKPKPKPARPKIEIKRIEKKAEEVMEKPAPEKDLRWLYWAALIAIAVIAFVSIKKDLFLGGLNLLWGFFLSYWVYILIGLIGLVLVIGITGRKKEAKEKKPAFGWLRSLVGLVVVLLILAAFVFAAYIVIRYLIIPYWVYIVVALFFLIVLLFSSWVLKAIKTTTGIEKTWAEATSQTDLSLAVEGKRFGFGELILRPRVKVNNVRLSMKKLYKKPTLLRASDKVYEYFELGKENIESNDIKKATLRFKIPKSWLMANDMDKEDITLKNYTNRWQNIATNIVDSDDRYVYYEAELKRLSYFAIASKKPKEEVEKPVKEASLRWLVVLLIILIVAGGFYFYDYFKAGEIPAIEEREPVISKVFTEQVWDEDTQHKIDLNNYFTDPDGDKLKFTSTTPENIKVTIKDSVVTLIPKPNWHGTDYIIFIADDGKGGIVSTERVTLIIRDVPEEILIIRIRNWLNSAYFVFITALGGYLQYIVYGIIGLLILIIVVRYNKAIIDFFLEDEKKK